MSTRVDIDQADVLIAFVNALRGATLPDGTQLTDKTCFLSYYEEPQRVPDIVFVTVALGDGTFPQGFQVGGGLKQCSEDFELAVTIWSRHPSNQVGHDGTGLVDKSRGVVRIKNRLLRQLVSADIGINYPPGTPGVNTFLRNLITATRTSRPEHGTFGSESAPITKLAIYFSISFDHDLSS